MRSTRGCARTSSDRPGRPFLTARWVNVALLSYPVPDEALAPHLPPGLALDLWEGSAFVSLVAFDFLDTRVGGIAWPGFTEVNLRFYVREGDRRGVVFIAELVPSRMVAFLARLFYNEPYRVAGFRSATETTGGVIRVVHDLHRDGRRHRIAVEARCPAEPAAEEGATHFFKEHAWGYGTDRHGRALRYAVDHPLWRVYPGATARAEVEFGALYGPRWAFLTDCAPAHVALAEGSPVAVYPGARLAAAPPT
jgi:uncharacterized protein